MYFSFNRPIPALEVRKNQGDRMIKFIEKVVAVCGTLKVEYSIYENGSMIEMGRMELVDYLTLKKEYMK